MKRETDSDFNSIQKLMTPNSAKKCLTTLLQFAERQEIQIESNFEIRLSSQHHYSHTML